jgi:predicted alpha/beta-fold hydrolase
MLMRQTIRLWFFNLFILLLHAIYYSHAYSTSLPQSSPRTMTRTTSWFTRNKSRCHLQNLQTLSASPLFFDDFQNVVGVTRETVNDVNNSELNAPTITPVPTSSTGTGGTSNLNNIDQSMTVLRPSFRPKTERRRPPTSLFFADQVVASLNTNESLLSVNKPNINPYTKYTSLQEYQELSKSIATSFKPKTYTPHPLLTNEHLQTILGVFLRDDPGCAYINPNARNTFEEILPVAIAFLTKLPRILGFEQAESECDYWDERERIRTNDGDFFDVDYKYVVGNKSKGMVVIVHGLESNSNSTVCVNMARSFQNHNFDVACMNFRGCSGTPNDTIYQYHGGFTDDLKHLIELLSERQRSNSEEKPLYISGFSLGANIVLKCLGEMSFEAVTRNFVRGAAVTAAPFHLRPHHRRLIDEPFQRIIYAASILKSMKSKLDYIIDRFCDGNKDTNEFDYWMVRNATTIAEVEDGMIAPLFGFRDKFDYFEKSASLPLIDKIAVPTFVLNAADDPFFSKTFFPWDKDCENGGIAPMKLERTEYGGHLGHMFCMPTTEPKTTRNQEEEIPVASFALSELGRFIDHVHTKTSKT